MYLFMYVHSGPLPQLPAPPTAPRGVPISARSQRGIRDVRLPSWRGVPGDGQSRNPASSATPEGGGLAVLGQSGRRIFAALAVTSVTSRPQRLVRAWVSRKLLIYMEMGKGVTSVTSKNSESEISNRKWQAARRQVNRRNPWETMEPGRGRWAVVPAQGV